MSESAATCAALRAAILEEQVGLLDAALKKFRNCVRQLDETQLWWRPAAAQNSVANLMLHVSGNLTQWVICGVGGETDQRDRESEFAADGGLTSAELWETMTRTIDEVKVVLAGVSAEQLLAPRIVQGFEVTGLGALIHSITHFVGHTHQVIQLTRLQLGDAYEFEWTPPTADDQLPI